MVSVSRKGAAGEGGKSAKPAAKVEEQECRGSLCTYMYHRSSWTALGRGGKRAVGRSSPCAVFPGCITIGLGCRVALERRSPSIEYVIKPANWLLMVSKARLFLCISFEPLDIDPGS